MNNQAFLTMDSGGSKTVLSLYSHDGVPIKTEKTRGFGIAEDIDGVSEEVRQILSDFGLGYKVSYVICNLGGKNKSQIEKTVKSVFPDAAARVFRESEGTIGLELCRMYSADVTLMAGTGAIAIAPIGDKAVISGGWGANISDKGSGYQLGLDAVRLALEELDGTGELSLLTKSLTGINESPKPMDAKEYCEFRDNVRRSLAPFDRAHIASFARTVYDTARLGDEKAVELYKNAGLDLAELVITAARKAQNRLCCVVVNGGMVSGKEFWMESFEERLNNKYAHIKVHYLTNGIDKAMCHMAEKMIKGE